MKKYSSYLFTLLRILIGWHFLYEGIAKLINPGWTAKYYLLGSKWIFAGLFHWMASSQTIINIVDFLNVWGLILIGLSLFIGLFVRWSAIAGAVLLFFYFASYPPIFGYTFGVVAEGNYQWVDKNLIELIMLVVLASLPADFLFGADRWLRHWKEEKPNAPIPSSGDGEGFSSKRRELLRDMIGVPFLGAFAYVLYKKTKWESFEKKYLLEKPDAISSATLKSFQFTSLSGS